MRLVFLIALIPFAAFGQDADLGGELFIEYCATCHGQDATGYGPMTEILLIEPPDLTVLAEENDGVFPVARVAQRIDGRDPVVSHGGMMPVWGNYFDGGEAVAIPSEYGQPVITSHGIADIVTWLESIQK